MIPYRLAAVLVIAATEVAEYALIRGIHKYYSRKDRIVKEKERSQEVNKVSTEQHQEAAFQNEKLEKQTSFKHDEWVSQKDGGDEQETFVLVDPRQGFGILQQKKVSGSHRIILVILFIVGLISCFFFLVIKKKQEKKRNT